MFKLVVLFSVLALAAANPDVWPLTYNTVPGYNSWVNGYPTPAVYGASYDPYGTGYTLSQAPNTADYEVHQIAKRSVAYNPAVPVSAINPVVRTVSPVTYPSPFFASYGARFAPYTYGGVVPKALPVYPWELK